MDWTQLGSCHPHTPTASSGATSGPPLSRSPSGGGWGSPYAQAPWFIDSAPPIDLLRASAVPFNGKYCPLPCLAGTWVRGSPLHHKFPSGPLCRMETTLTKCRARRGCWTSYPPPGSATPKKITPPTHTPSQSHTHLPVPHLRDTPPKSDPQHFSRTKTGQRPP